MDTHELQRRLRALGRIEIEEYEQQFARERAECFTPVRARELVLNSSRWTEDERRHRDSCPHCARMIELYEDKVAHPSFWLLMRGALGLLSDDECEAVRYHLEVDACEHCRHRVRQIDTAPSRSRQVVVAFRQPVQLRNPAALACATPPPNVTEDWLGTQGRWLQRRGEQTLKETATAIHDLQHDPSVLDHLVRLMGKSQDVSPRLSAIRAVSTLGAADATPEILARLREIMGDPSEEVRVAAGSALRELGRPSQWEKLVDEGLEVQIIEQDWRESILLEIRTRNQEFNNRLLGCGFRGASAGPAFLHFVVLHRHENDWWTAQLRFGRAEFYDQLDGVCQDLLVSPIEVDDLTGDEREALLKSVRRDRDDPPAREAWAQWLAGVQQAAGQPRRATSALLAALRDELAA